MVSGSHRNIRHDRLIGLGPHGHKETPGSDMFEPSETYWDLATKVVLNYMRGGMIATGETTQYDIKTEANDERGRACGV